MVESTGAIVSAVTYFFLKSSCYSGGGRQRHPFGPVCLLLVIYFESTFETKPVTVLRNLVIKSIFANSWVRACLFRKVRFRLWKLAQGEQTNSLKSWKQTVRTFRPKFFVGLAKASPVFSYYLFSLAFHNKMASLSLAGKLPAKDDHDDHEDDGNHSFW